MTGSIYIFSIYDNRNMVQSIHGNTSIVLTMVTHKHLQCLKNVMLCTLRYQYIISRIEIKISQFELALSLCIKCIVIAHVLIHPNIPIHMTSLYLLVEKQLSTSSSAHHCESLWILVCWWICVAYMFCVTLKVQITCQLGPECMGHC